VAQSWIVTKRFDASESFGNTKILKEKPMFKTFSTMTILGMLAVSAAQAQTGSTIRAKVPFAFAVQNTMLAPGNYALTYNRTSHILTVRGLDRKSGLASVLAAPAFEARQGYGPAKLVFGCYGETCTLTRVLRGGSPDSEGIMLPNSKPRNFAARLVSITIPAE
jgi:hypothetical protein